LNGVNHFDIIFVGFNWNASTATALAAGRTISGTGGYVYYRCFDGTGNVQRCAHLTPRCNRQSVNWYASGPGGVVAATDLYLATKFKREYRSKWIVTAANYKAGVTAAGVANELTLYSHSYHTSSFNRDDFL
jgi:hypothetical protein